MTTETESISSAFEQVFDNLRKTTQSALEMQQDLFRQWGTRWPGFPSSQNDWLERIQKFQQEWAETVTDLAKKHRQALDDQYRVGLESLEEAFHVAESTDPMEYRKRCEQLCRKSLECLKESAELQMRESQEAMNKWLQLAAKAGS